MIQTFGHKGLARFFNDGSGKALPSEFLQELSDILDMLDAAHVISDMDSPGAHLHPLKGDRKRFWAVKVSGNWRVIFRFENGDAFDVDFIDYH